MLLSLFLLLFSAIVQGQVTGISNSAFGLNGRLLAAADYSGNLSVWDLPTGKEIQTFSFKPDQTDALAFSPDGKTLSVFDAKNSRMLFLDVAAGKEIKRLGLRNVSSLFSGLTIFTSNDSKTLWLFSNANNESWAIDLKTNALKQTEPIKGHSWIFDTSKNWLAYYSETDKKIIILSANTGKEMKRFSIAENFISNGKDVSMNLNVSGEKLFVTRTYSEDDKENSFNKNYFHEIKVYSTADGKELTHRTIPASKNGQTVLRGEPIFSLSSDSLKLFLIENPGFYDESAKPNHLTVLSANSLQTVDSTDFPDENYEWFETTPDGKSILTADQTGKIKVWTNGAKKPPQTLFSTETPYEQLAVSADDSKFAGISANGTIKIWNADGKELQKIQTELPHGKMIAFSPNGQNIVSVHTSSYQDSNDDSSEKSIAYFKIWNISSGKLLREFDNRYYLKYAPENFITYDKKGERLIADCTNGENKIDICLWNAETGEFSARSFPIKGSNTISIFRLGDNQAFSFGNKESKMLTAGEENQSDYLIWDLSNEKLIKQTSDLDEVSTALVSDQKSTVITINSGFSEGRNYWILPLDAKTGLNTKMEDFGTGFIHPNQEIGAKFTTTEKTAAETPEPVKIPDFSPLDANSPNVFLEKPDDLDNEVQIFKLDGQETISRLKGHADNLIDLVFMKNTTRVVTSGFDRTVRLWDLNSGTQIAALR